MKRRIYSLLILLISGLIITGAEATSFQHLFTISNIKATDIAVDLYGNIWVANSINMFINKYNYQARLTGQIILKDKPLSLAVSPANLLYVGYGNRDSIGGGYVEVYNASDGKLIEKITGLGQPNAFAFSSSGSIYIVDTNNYKIHIYDASHRFINSFGNYTIFRDPSSIAINEELREIYVLDRGNLTRDPSGYTTYAWRIQVFDLDWNKKREFSYYGLNQEGRVHTASGLAIDREGNLYIPDWMQSIIVVYGSQGNYIKTIYDNNKPLYFPNDIALQDNKLYVASYATNSVYALGINNYAHVGVSPEELNVTWNTSSSTTLSLILSNSGRGALNYQLSTDSNWITLSSKSGTIPAGSSAEIAVIINTAGLSEGTYNGKVSILSNGGSRDIPVTLNVLSPVLTVSPNSFDLITTKGSTVEPLIVNIGISKDATNSITWTATSDSPWLTITPVIGPSNSTVSANILINTALNPGKYTGYITVTATGAEGSPTLIRVNLEIKTSRKITVSTNLDSASFSITGPVIYEGSGINFTIDNPPAGKYTVTFKPVKGYKTPKPQEGTLLEEGELAFNGNYISLAKKLQILASHGPGNMDNMEIRVYEIAGRLQYIIKPPKDFMHGATAQTGDINGDGINEIVIGTGPGAKVPALVIVMDLKGNILGEFRPFDGYRYGIELSLADLDGDGAEEIIVAKTRKLAGAPLVDLKTFKYTQGQFIDTGLSLVHEGAKGIRITSADLNDDSVPEVMVGPASGNGPVYVYHIDTTSTPWQGKLLATYEGCSGTGGVNMASGDIDGDAIPEILLACQSDTGTKVRIINASGTLLSEFFTGSNLRDYIGAGDLNEDGLAEVIIGDGPAAHKKKIKIFNPQGGLLNSFDAFEDSFGVRVSTGRID